MGRWVRVMVEFGTSSTFRGWVRVRVLGHGSGVRGRKIKSRDCALASDLVRALWLALLHEPWRDATQCEQARHDTKGFTGLARVLHAHPARAKLSLVRATAH